MAVNEDSLSTRSCAMAWEISAGLSPRRVLLAPGQLVWDLWLTIVPLGQFFLS